MSVSNTVVSQLYSANGSQTTFAIPFAFLTGTASDVTKVYTIATDGTKTLKTISTHYTLPSSPPADPTNVEFNSAPASGLRVLVERQVTFNQLADYINSGTFLAETHEAVMDRLVLMTQQLKNVLDRVPKISELNTLTVDLLKGSANQALAINGAGTGIVWAEIENIAGALAIISNLSDLADAVEALVNLGIAPLSYQNEHSITNSQSATALTDESFDGGDYTSVVFEYEIKQGTTIFANGKMALQYLNSTWQLILGSQMDNGTPHGVTFSITQAGAIATLKAAEGGSGNGTIKIKKHYFFA